MAEEPSATLNTGAKIPLLGLGTWLSKREEVAAAVEIALKAGYRHIDCAHIYGNEVEIGNGLQKCFKDGVVKREEIFVTSKLWHTDHAPEDVLQAYQTTLKNLQLDYLDLYLIHGPLDLRKGAPYGQLTDEDKLGYNPEVLAKCWESMEQLYCKGLVKAIGISNFSIVKTECLLETAKIMPACNQVECHPYFQQRKMKEYCDSKGMVFAAYSPLGAPTRPLKTDADPVVMEDPIIKDIAAKHNITPAQVCISFALHRGMVVVPKSANPARIIENLKAREVKLDAEDMKRLTEIKTDIKLITGKPYMHSATSFEDVWDFCKDKMFIIKKPEAK